MKKMYKLCLLQSSNSYSLFPYRQRAALWGQFQSYNIHIEAVISWTFPCLIEPFKDVLRTSSGRHQDKMSSGGPQDLILGKGQYTSGFNMMTLQNAFLNRYSRLQYQKESFKQSSTVSKNIKVFVAATEKKSPVALIFQLPQYKRCIIVADTEDVYDPGGFLCAEQRPLS